MKLLDFGGLIPWIVYMQNATTSVVKLGQSLKCIALHLRHKLNLLCVVILYRKAFLGWLKKHVGI